MGLQAGPINHLSWSFRVNDGLYYAETAIALGDTVSGTLLYVTPEAGPDVANWSATPPDILSRRGEAADPIIDFPLT